MYYYRLYGMILESEIPFSEADELPSPAAPDATLTLGIPPEWVVTEYRQGKFSSISEQIMWFRLYDELLVYVEHGTKAIIWKLNPCLDEVRMRTYLLSGAVTFLLLQRGYLLIHGSALCCRGKAYLISGPSGSGKSTTALQLMKQPGVLFASDDICAVRTENGQSILYQGPPWQRVCADVMQSNPDSEYTYIREADEKYGRKLATSYCREPLPVAGMFLICRADCEKLSCEELFGNEKLQALTHNLFRGELLNLLGITPARMQQFLSAVQSFPIYQLTRPQDRDTTAEIPEIILKYINDVRFLVFPS